MQTTARRHRRISALVMFVGGFLLSAIANSVARRNGVEPGAWATMGGLLMLSGIVLAITTLFSSAAPAAIGGAGLMVCATCGSQTAGHEKKPGSFGVELFLWLFLIVPGILYTAWRYTAARRVCDACGGGQLVPANSPVGRRLATG